MQCEYVSYVSVAKVKEGLVLYKKQVHKNILGPTIRFPVLSSNAFNLHLTLAKLS